MFEKNRYDRRLKIHKSILISIWVAFPILILMALAGIRTVHIVGTSMFPSIQHNDYMVSIEKYDRINRFDFVCLLHHGRSLIKRAIGLPGDRITINANRLIINGHELTERYLFENPEYIKELDIVLKEDEYFVLGDNRNISLDSRSFGPVKSEQITEKVVMRVWRQ